MWRGWDGEPIMQRKIMTGNAAAGFAMKQINPDVVAAYPITPQTELMETFCQFVADGAVDTNLVCVESEHSALSACVGASAAGARVMTATSANGFALMWEVVYIAASLRLPIIMPVVNRALSGPINIHNDHSDTMGARDAGWVQIYCENSQEAYDTVLQAVRIGENSKVMLPVMVMYDGFIISHTMEVLEVLDDDVVKKFVGQYKPERYLLDINHPITVGPLDFHDYYFEHKRQQVDAMEEAKRVIPQVEDEYFKLSGRRYGFFEEYKLADADYAIVVMSSTAGTAKPIVDELRAQGEKVGLLRPRVFRPFPAAEMAAALSHLKGIAIMDKVHSFGGYGGPLFTEIRSALAGLPKVPPSMGFVYGLGGRDTDMNQIRHAFAQAKKVASGVGIDTIEYLGVRE
jgi:pyruvate ferredoxin oxidoreductase alpha subunit